MAATQMMQLPSLSMPPLTAKLEAPPIGLAGVDKPKTAQIPQMMSYARFVRDRNEFRRSGTKNGSDFNIFDTPTLKFFKILFYFHGKSEHETDERMSTGLLAPAWEYKLTDNSYWKSTSAWAYLMMNDEVERADKLRHFISLLSNINSESPWYFSAISGLDSALERKVATDGKLDLSEVKKLQIKCLPDAVDDRIGTLLSLYRDVAWSWSMKKEILPVNLRKFDMAVYVIETPMHFIHSDKDVVDGKSGFKPSYKMFEFHNCEFDYNSIKSGYSEISNQTGVQPTYTIDIMYDDCYEVAYNSIMMRTIGDVIATDTAYVCMVGGDTEYKVKSEAQTDSNEQMLELQSRMKHDLSWTVPKMETPKKSPIKNAIQQENKTKSIGGSTKKSPIKNAIQQVIGAVEGDLKSLVKRAILGNIYTASLTQVASEFKSLSEGNVIAAAQTVKGYIKTSQERAAMKNKKSAEGNIYGSVEELVRNKPTGDIYPEPTQSVKPKLGNLYKGSIANN